MAQPISAELKDQLLAEKFRPAILSRNRLEGRPRKEDFDRSLRAEIRDPLWMICRQWQFGEFKGEDAGSAIKAKAQVATARLNRYAAGNQPAVAYDDQLPLETMVEREPVHFDLMTRAQMGRHWFKLLDDIGNLANVNALKNFYLNPLNPFGFTDPQDPDSEEAFQLNSDGRARQTLALLKGRVVDGQKLHNSIRSPTNEHENLLEGAGLSSEDHQNVLEAAKEFLAWFGRVYSQPESIGNTAWSDSNLEYQFSCAAPADEEGKAQTVLISEQYHHGHLDWYAFDIDSRSDARLIVESDATSMEEKLLVEDPISFIPNPIEFGGMPNARWWEFEDHKTDFGNINPSTSDLATLMLAEFGLIFGNDWSVVPYVLEVGTLSEVRGVVITDVFGVRTLIQPAAEIGNGDRMRWGMYYLHQTDSDRLDSRLFLPPAVGKIQESTPIERVILVRDEMANMVWGIEDMIPSLSSGGTNGYEAATNLKTFLLDQAPSVTVSQTIETDATIQYKLGTTVSENWIPFIPVHLPGSNQDIRLQRAAMLRPKLTPDGNEGKPVEPRGAVLRPGLDKEPPQPYFLQEREVSRAGALVTRTYQRARWMNGKVYAWLGRRTQTGRGQASSGLTLDRIVPVDKVQ